MKKLSCTVKFCRNRNCMKNKGKPEEVIINEKPSPLVEKDMVKKVKKRSVRAKLILEHIKGQKMLTGIQKNVLC